MNYSNNRHGEVSVEAHDEKSLRDKIGRFVSQEEQKSH